MIEIMCFSTEMLKLENVACFYIILDRDFVKYIYSYMYLILSLYSNTALSDSAF